MSQNKKIRTKTQSNVKIARFWDELFIENKSYFNHLKVVRDRFKIFL
ncbi:hypothetical protein LEP1GSC005_3988 [Leptospira santarosai str. ST188]|nr:hypothetical protein LEP1GSC005_3988 [Leptospira santarosai str. ST188]